jgi:3-hydroxybutyryl-CoA dehydrogenase
LLDSLPDSFNRARREISNSVKLDRIFRRGDSRAEAILDNIEFTTDVARLADVGFLVENITEDETLKKPVYQTVDALCRPECIFAANTSAIPITAIGSWTQRADRVIGIHFMNPVPAKKMVEVIRGIHTSDSSTAIALEFLRRIGKEAVMVNDSPGFVSNRVLMLTINEAIFLLHEQVANAENIDKVFSGCFGHPMGPLATADLIGLDTILQSIQVLQNRLSDTKYLPCPLLRQMVDAGWLGRKSGRGFFIYDQDSQTPRSRSMALGGEAR